MRMRRKLIRVMIPILGVDGEGGKWCLAAENDIHYSNSLCTNSKDICSRSLPKICNNWVLYRLESWDLLMLSCHRLQYQILLQCGIREREGWRKDSGRLVYWSLILKQPFSWVQKELNYLQGAEVTLFWGDAAKICLSSRSLMLNDRLLTGVDNKSSCDTIYIIYIITYFGKKELKTTELNWFGRKAI